MYHKKLLNFQFIKIIMTENWNLDLMENSKKGCNCNNVST